MFGRNGAAARSAVVMNGFSAAPRQAKNRSAAPSLAACLRFPKAATGSSKNMTPKREMIVAKIAGSKGWNWASADRKSVVEGKSVSVRVNLVGCGTLKKKQKRN